MTREFVILREFDRQWVELGLTEEDLADLQMHLCRFPAVGVIIPGTGGLRKLRWALPGKGKRGGARVCYVDLIIHEKIYLITAYGKNEKENITESDKVRIRSLLKALENEAGCRGVKEAKNESKRK